MHEPGSLKISQLRALVAVADSGNFSTAALDLQVSQSTVSHAIATLETELDVILLIRGRHGAILTEIGTQIVADARQILSLLDAIQHKAQLESGLQSGTIRVATVRSLATHLLPDVIVQFCQKFPKISVAIRDCDYYPEVEQLLQDGQVEIGLTLLPTHLDFETWPLIQDEFLLLRSSDSDKRTELTWNELAGYPMIMNPIAVNTRTVREHLAQFGCPLRVAYEVKEDSTILGMVQRGLGATIMARLAAEPMPATITACQLPVPLVRSIGAAIRREALLPRATFAFLDVLKAVSDGVMR